MKITYDSEANAIYIKLSDKKIARTEYDDALTFGVDYAEDGTTRGVEILDARKQVDNPDRIEFEAFTADLPLR